MHAKYEVLTENFNFFSQDALILFVLGTTTLYVVNHPVQYDTVEKFQYVAEKNVLQHLATFKHPSMKLWVCNSVQSIILLPLPSIKRLAWNMGIELKINFKTV